MWIIGHARPDLKLFLHVDDRLTALADADPFDRHAQLVLDHPDVVLCLRGQFVEVAHVLRRLEPARHGNVVDFDLGQVGY